MNELIKELKWRGLLKDIANETELSDIVETNSKFYIGIDPTAESIHVGHYLSLNLANILNKHGLKPVLVIGGFTGMIGDPSGRNSEREVIDVEKIKHNISAIKNQIITLSKNLNMDDVEVFDNTDVYKDMNIIDLFQKYGKLININNMLGKESVKNRLENGISYTEFSYQLFQAIDYLYLYENKNVRLQIGGSDQWGNITAGIDLIKKVHGSKAKVSGLTINLLTEKNGNKIGKTQGIPMWLDKNKTSTYALFQYFLNLPDETAKKLLARATLISEQDYESCLKEHEQNPSQKSIQNELAKRFIENVHGEEEYSNAKELSKILFEEKYESINSKHESFLNMMESIQNENISLMDLLIKNNKIGSKRIYREFIETSAIKVNGVSIKDENDTLEEENFINNRFAFINIGKKNKLLVVK